MNELSFSLFAKLFNGQAERQISLAELQVLIKGDFYKFATSEVRRLTSEGRKEEAKHLKLQLPCIAVAGRFGERRCLESLLALNGMTMVDIDHTTRPVADLLEVCCALPYVALGCRSVSGEGIHLLVRTGNTDPGRYRDICLAVAAAVSRITGEAVDGACKDVARCMLLNHDPQCYINPEAACFEVPVETPTRPTDPPSALDPSFLLEAYLNVSESTLSWQPGMRHTCLTSLAGCLSLAGFDEAEATRAVVRRYAAADFTAEEITRTIASIYASGQANFGRNKMVGKKSEKKVSAINAINASNFSDDDLLKAEEAKFAERERIDSSLELFPPEVYDLLHPFFKKIIALQQPGRLRDVALLGALTIMSSVTPRVQGSYGGATVHPQLFLIVTAYPGSGKGVLNQLRVITSGWHRYVREKSRREVAKYERALLVYARDIANWQKQKGGTPPEKPEEVKQMELAMAGDTTKAKMVEQLSANDHYPSLLLETEMRVVTIAMRSDHGKFADLLNSLGHNETISRDTKSSGHFCIESPKLSVALTGVPRQLPDFFGNTDDGLTSRFLIYMMPDEAKWKNLTSIDDTPDAANYYLQFSSEVMDIGIHLDAYKTFVYFTKEQRDELNRVFTEMVDHACIFGDVDRKAFIYRNALAVFRICMTLTAVRKATDGIKEERIAVHPDDFRVALAIALTSLKHVLVAASFLPRNRGTDQMKSPTYKEEIFIALPDRFYTDEVSAIAEAYSVSKRTVCNWLQSWQKGDLISCVIRGCYDKTRLGKRFTASRKK